ncbi:MAG: 50S ribosomal protein L19 [bacterium]
MKQSVRKLVEEEIGADDYPAFQPGDQIRVVTREEIAGMERKTTFEGVCIARRGEGPDETFKVRKNSFGVGVERIFPLNSPIIEEVKILRKGKVRRSKLNYLAGRSAKNARIKEKRVDLDEANAPGTAEATADKVETSEVTEEDEVETSPGEESKKVQAEETNADDSAEASENSETMENEEEEAGE